MPCRVDYPTPSYDTKRTMSKLEEKARTLGDEATYSADVIREYILTGIELEPLTKHVGKAQTRTLKFAEIMEDVTDHREYYYSSPFPDSILHSIETALREDRTAERMYIKHMSKEGLTEKQFKTVEKKQIAHREKDLKRLMKTFGARADRKRLQKVLDATPEKALEPQLGFSPDAY